MPTLYSHRNGEYETPTEPGLYWFSHKLNKSPVFSYYTIDVGTNGIWAIPGVDEYMERAELMEGRWWGPIPEPQVTNS